MGLFCRLFGTSLFGDVADFTKGVEVWHGAGYLNCRFSKSSRSVAIHVIIGCRCTVCSSEEFTPYTQKRRKNSTWRRRKQEKVFRRASATTCKQTQVPHQTRLSTRWRSRASSPSSTAVFCNCCPTHGLRHRLRALALQGRLGRQKSLLTDRRAKSDAGRLEGLARVALSGRADDERFLVHGNR